MAEQQKIHFSDGTKIICGTKEGAIASGEQVVTCGRCIALLEQRQTEVEEAKTSPPFVADPNAIHFSDGTKSICGASKDAQAVIDEQKVTCKNCQVLLAKRAKVKGDPLMSVRVKNMDLNDGVDFAFSFGRDPDKPKQMKGYHLVNNAIHMLSKSVVKHLRSLAYPYKRYVPGQESGRAMQVAGTYTRFVIQEM